MLSDVRAIGVPTGLLDYQTNSSTSGEEILLSWKSAAPSKNTFSFMNLGRTAQQAGPVVSAQAMAMEAGDTLSYAPLTGSVSWTSSTSQTDMDSIVIGAKVSSDRTILLLVNGKPYPFSLGEALSKGVTIDTKENENLSIVITGANKTSYTPAQKALQDIFLADRDLPYSVPLQTLFWKYVDSTIDANSFYPAFLGNVEFLKKEWDFKGARWRDRDAWGYRTRGVELKEMILVTDKGRYQTGGHKIGYIQTPRGIYKVVDFNQRQNPTDNNWQAGPFQSKEDIGFGLGIRRRF